MKKTVHAIMAAAVVATALAAKAETVVWYTFDDLGDVGTTLADSSTIQNKANPGTLDATVYGMKGKDKYASSVNKPYVANGVPETLRVLDPVSKTIAASADKALSFPCTSPGGQGALLETPNDSAFRPSSFTVEMFVRLTEGRSNWQILACQPSTTADRYGWAISLYQSSSGVAMKLMFIRADGTQQECQFNGNKATDALLDWKWHHIAMTVYPHATDSSKTVVRFYFDYAKIYDYDAPFVLSLSDSADCPVQIGGTTVTGQNFMGEIGEFRFSSGVLDPGEFLRPHNAAIDKDVVLYYDFEDTDAYDGNFAYSTSNDVVNKASPIMPGAFQTAVGTDSKTYPFIDEASPGHRVLPSQNAESERTMNSTHAFRNASYQVVGSNTSRLKCTPAYADIFRDTEDFTVEMFYKCGEKEYSDETIVQQAKLLIIPGQFEVGFADPAAQMIPILKTSGGNVMFSSGTRVDDGKWHHIAVVVKQSGDSKTFSWYHDGDLYNNQSKTFSGTVSPMTSGAVWHIGTNNGGRAFDGWIDSLRVTLRALEPSEFLHAEKRQGLSIIFR